MIARSERPSQTLTAPAIPEVAPAIVKMSGRQQIRHAGQALRDRLDAIVDLAAEIEADALCGGGDLYEHDRVAPDIAAVIRDAFARLARMPVLVAPGNPDPLSFGETRHSAWAWPGH